MRLDKKLQPLEAAPIALFVYSRLFHTIETITALQKNTFAKASDLFVFSDGPKDGSGSSQVNQVRDYIKSIDGFKSITIIESKKNKGLSESIISGIDYVLKRYDEVIVMEDDLVTSPFFLQYMNEGLEIYKKDAEVISIHGYCLPIESDLPESYFIKGADCWGWAVWRDSWTLFERNGDKLLKEIKQRKLVREFDFNNSAGYTQMLMDQIKGKNDSWAVRWYASAFLNNKLTLHPGKSFVQNIGHDGYGSHGSKTDAFHRELNSHHLRLKRIEIKEDQNIRYLFEKFFKSIEIKRKILSIIISKFKKICNIFK